jgi:hypothetical protein
MVAKSHTIIFQLTSLPRARGNSYLELLNSLLASTSFNQIASLLGFGTSIPTTPSPGIGAWILIDLA